MHTYRSLVVWRRSRAVAIEVYRLTRGFPTAERYGLTAQLRRAATSVTANIVEGATRQSNRDFARFLTIAEGSTAEVRVLLELSTDLGYAGGDAAALSGELAQIGLMLGALRRRVSGE